MSLSDNFFVWWRRDGFKKAWAKLVYNWYMLETPEAGLRKQCWGYYGTLFGLAAATPLMFREGRWYFSIVCCGAWWISYCQFKTVKRQLLMLKQVKEQFETKGALDSIK